MEVRIRPQLSFALPDGITDREVMEHLPYYDHDFQMDAIITTIFECDDDDPKCMSVKDSLDREIGRLQGWFDSLG